MVPITDSQLEQILSPLEKGMEDGQEIAAKVGVTPRQVAAGDLRYTGGLQCSTRAI